MERNTTSRTNNNSETAPSTINAIVPALGRAEEGALEVGSASIVLNGISVETAAPDGDGLLSRTSAGSEEFCVTC